MDTGAEVSLIKYERLTLQSKENIDKSCIEIFSGLGIESMGRIFLTVKLGERLVGLHFHVVKSDFLNLPFNGIYRHNLLLDGKSYINYEKSSLIKSIEHKSAFIPTTRSRSKQLLNPIRGDNSKLLK